MNWTSEQMAEITVLQPEQVIDEVKAVIATEGLTQSKVAGELGVGSSTLSQILSGSYKGNMDDMAQRLVRWLRHRGRQQEASAIIPKVPSFLDTPTSRLVMSRLEQAQLLGQIAVIYSGAGLGKTSAIEEYRCRNAETAFVVTCSPDCASAGVFLEEISIALGLKAAALHPARLRREIVNRLKDMTSPLMMIDEAQHLTKMALEEARSLHDRTAGMGLAMLGNAQVYRRIYGANSEKEDFAQLFSRVGIRLKLIKPKAGDVHAVAGAFGIGGADCLAYLENIARNAGALRGVVMTIRLAFVMTAGQDGPIALADLKMAWRHLQGDDSAGE